MGKGESQNIPLRELIRMQMNMLEENKRAMDAHKRESTVFREETKIQLSKIDTSIATIETHSVYAKEAIQLNTADIKSLKDSRSWIKGVIAVLTSLGILTAIANFFLGKE